QPVSGPGEQRAAAAPNPIKRFLRILGPGFITGASDDDPSGIGTYAVAGASFGFATLWTALVSFPMMASWQYICAKAGLGSGLCRAGVLGGHCARWVSCRAIVGLLIANTINVCADIGASAAAIKLLVPIPSLLMIVPIALAIVALQIWGSYRLIERTF